MYQNTKKDAYTVPFLGFQYRLDVKNTITFPCDLCEHYGEAGVWVETATAAVKAEAQVPILKKMYRNYSKTPWVVPYHKL